MEKSKRRATSSSKGMEENTPSKRRAISSRGMEENTMAILDSFCALDSSHVHDDRLAFLEAVRSASVVPETGIPPTKKMMEAILEILRESKSLELIIASYQLLVELEKHFPRVYLSNEDDGQSSSSKSSELVVIEEAWSPIAIGLDATSGDRHAGNKKSKEPIDAAGFHLLLEGLTEVDNESESSETKLEFFETMLLLQYLIHVLEGDFIPRNNAFLENLNWIFLRESLLNKFLGSRRINYKGFVNDCLFVLCNPLSARSQTYGNSGPAESSLSNMYSESDAALALCLPEVEKSTCIAVQKLLVMMMELDSSKKTADMHGLTTRADGPRAPVVELILDVLSYNKDLISPFLQAFDQPKWKLEIVSEYLQKYTAKPSTRNRRSNDFLDDAKITGFFKCFANNTSTKSIVKKVGAEEIQVLLAHALQACMSLPQEQLLEGISDLKEDAEKNPLVNICKNIIAAFTKLRETNEHLQILPIGNEALFTAATILSTSSCVES